MKHYRLLAAPMGAIGALLLTQGWLALLLGFAYGLLCLLYAYSSIKEQDERRADEELRRLLDDEAER